MCVPYSCHAEVSKDTLPLATGDTPVLDLRGPSVAVHLRELKLRLGPRALREHRVANHISQGLPIWVRCQKSCRICSGGDSSAGEAVVREGGGSGGGGFGGGSGSFVPFLLVLGKDLALGVVADNLDVDEAA